MYPSQDNITSRSAHESNITGFMNNDYAITAIQTEHPSSINCNNPSCSHNNGISSMNKNDDVFLSHAIISPDHNNYQQSMSNNISNNNDIISPAHNDYQRQISNDASNENVNISPGNKYQQPMPNNVSSSQFSPQYNDQISPRSNVFPLLNSLGITINSPGTNIIIVPSTSSDILNLLQQDRSTYSNNFS
ncbi:hypothetical protein RhiirA5_432590 [Rhizophagus irregularis]|uniref:Uncharacterized protein n=1 Tax=Rhizophagus irregularis TaxID=588596 RepID=A0A2I1EEF5_9GLOM|nr:hypothetical protein RhiirA5_432590 [Rhizophagus irregularis]PKC56878.1 hypothetical protein RhiirA1_473354 [Rhizophagus irregularis]PKY20518.1 hypothetical protein RhiirB3_433830 [Rhizophagus irregularis]CAB4444792.1 unnamed protein product [Rhizophagus irregularis]CAB4486006.1 unnamed protein product [Rhizophagus irregularis]